MRNSARKLQKEWGVVVKHGLYHHEGHWYHLPTSFPAALFDPNGYVRFETKEEYLSHPKLTHGAHLHVDGSINSMSQYVRMVAIAASEPTDVSGRERQPMAPRQKKPSNDASLFLSPEEVEVGARYREGSTRTVQVNVYERSRKARRQCIAHHGTSCAVCGFEFQTRFGKIGAGFIHVHHLRDLASIGTQYEVDPKNDLRPICPNCHAMIHRRSPPFSIDELKALVR